VRRVSPTKHITIAGRSLTLAGISADDIYFQNVTGDLDPEFQKFCRNFVRRDYVCLDIGANIGMKSLLLSGLVPEGRIVAIEAAPRVFPILQRNIADNGIPNVAVMHCAVGASDGEVKFNDNSAWGYISDHGVTVPLKRLSTIIAEQGLARVDLIKMDVEGYEFEILQDAIETINEHRALVVFEYCSWTLMAHAETNPLTFARWIMANFSHVYLLRREGEPFITRVPPGAAGAALLAHTNITEDASVSDVVATNAPEKLLAVVLDLEAEARTMRAERDALTVQLSATIAERDRVVAKADAALSERDDALAQVASLSRERDRLSQEREALSRETDAARAHAVAALAARSDEAAAHLAAMRSSTSWRVSAPIRTIGRWLKPHRG
jgi:FkbM family methyltransferase